MEGSSISSSDGDKAVDETGLALLPMTSLRKRGDFLRASRAARVSTPAFILQMYRRAPDDVRSVRVGFTCSKKVGNAVARNRAKRRLREIARLVLPHEGRAGTDYVLIGRRDATAQRVFASLLDDLRQALVRLHGERP
jgi:ribonuclease P protein component